MKRIAIVGAGFGGMQTAVELEKLFRNSADHEITLIGDTNYFMFTPLLPQVASSYINPRHIVEPVRDVRGRRKFRFLRDAAESVDLDARRLHLGVNETMDYDYLVLAPGSRTDYFGIPGARENTIDFKTLEDGVTLRERILDLCEHADHASDPAERMRLLTVVVVGGGYTGVELMAELRDFFHKYVLRKYRGIQRSDLKLVILEAGPKILASVHPSLAEHAVRRLEQGGVQIRAGAKVTRCLPEGIEVGSEWIPAHTVIWAAGVRAHALVEALPGPHDRIGRAVVNAHLQFEGHPEVFVVGDSGSPSNVRDTPRIAPVAIRQGAVAARNIRHMESGEKLESYVHEDQGSLVELGMNDAVVNVFGIRFYGYVAWLIWNAIHLIKLVGFKKQVQVAMDWALGMVFPRDASSVRRPKDCPICGKEREEVQKARAAHA